jgi:cytochrome-b5 reductase
MRAYFPTSDPGLQGTFELMVRRGSEPPDEVAAWLHELPIGSKVAFRHPALCLKEQYPFEGKERFNMLAGGMGLAPMYQILWKMLFTPADERKAVLIYHSRTTADILLRRELDEWARALPHRLTVVHVVGDAPDAAPPEGWKTTDTYVAESGEVDKAKLSKYAFAPSKETLCFICGPPALYTALCGPREERALRQGTVLDQLGYTSSMIAKL